MKHVITLRLLVDTKNDRDEQMLEKASKFILEQAEKQLTNFHYEVLGTETGHTQPTRDESIRLIPRKIHYGLATYPCCSKSKQVARDRVVENWNNVTCKQCLKKKPETLQAELFA